MRGSGLPPRPILTAQGEDVYVEVPGVLTIRASFLSEGLFDEASGGDPEEEDLYEVEVTGESLPLALSFPRFAPSAPEWDPTVEGEAQPLPMERFALLLAWQLANAAPEQWEEVCAAARRWDSWLIEDGLQNLPSDWTPEPLLPDLD
jgi:hypothetical protein